MKVKSTQQKTHFATPRLPHAFTSIREKTHLHQAPVQTESNFKPHKEQMQIKIKLQEEPCREARRYPRRHPAQGTQMLLQGALWPRSPPGEACGSDVLGVYCHRGLSAPYPKRNFLTKFWGPDPETWVWSTNSLLTERKNAVS